MKHYNITVIGHVQGVGYRWKAQKQAQILGLKGFVKNLSNGSVYMEAEGSDEQLRNFVAWCKIGPANARIQEVIVNEFESRDYSYFEIKH